MSTVTIMGVPPAPRDENAAYAPEDGATLLTGTDGYFQTNVEKPRAQWELFDITVVPGPFQ